VRFGLHFDVEEAHKETFFALLRLLGDEGIGADRTIGMGTFDVIDEIQNVSFKEISNPTHWFNLGIFNPGLESQKISWEESFYSLGQRSGWVSGTSLRRGAVPVIEESSVLKSDSSPVGSVPMVLDHESKLIPEDKRISYSVYRDCRGFFIPCSPIN
jgi:CRISPR-associated protein Csm4